MSQYLSSRPEQRFVVAFPEKTDTKEKEAREDARRKEKSTERYVGVEYSPFIPT